MGPLENIFRVRWDHEVWALIMQLVVLEEKGHLCYLPSQTGTTMHKLRKGHVRRWLPALQKEDSHQNPPMLPPWLQISRFWNHGEINFWLTATPLWYFDMTAWADLSITRGTHSSTHTSNPVNTKNWTLSIHSLLPFYIPVWASLISV